ncbi:WhiB family transcriptional regulator [Georgenia sp. 10Sc9-8]|uniref:WhiB family transcriptional regulator n=1 Tax=Georgenia halotolerans TaxID=3028317 RepID=A0ABT5TX18_9MICO|nr:WhiB family transcriptional regulator [Georgenia halotolerans]
MTDPRLRRTAWHRRLARRAAARRELFTVLATYPPGAVPCMGGSPVPSSHWTADEPELQAVAARACTGCPLREDCAAFAEVAPVEAGVYGGTSEYDRLPHRLTECYQQDDAPRRASNE